MHGLCVFFHFQFQMKIDGNSHRPELWLCVKRDVAPWLFMNWTGTGKMESAFC